MSWFRNLKVKNKLLIGFMFILIISVGAGVFSIIEMQIIDKSYADAMELTSRRIGYITKSNAHFSQSRLYLREAFYPDVTRDDLTRLITSIDTELDSMVTELNGLRQIAARAVQDKVDVILPQIERFHSDIKEIFEQLSAVETVSIYNADFIEASMAARNRINEIVKSYVGDMITTINSLPEMAIGIIENLSVENQEKASRDKNIMIMVYSVMSIATIFVAVYISGLISKPLAKLSIFMKKVGATGDITLSPKDTKDIEEMVRIRDETGQTAEGASALLKHITNISGKLETIADGDLTVTIKPLSDADTMGNSLLNMVGSLNNMFGEIQTSTGQVSINSKQIANGALSLAQGSTEQASAIQQLSSSIASITEKTKKNAITADKTSKLSEGIKDSAEKGSRQMDDMIIAVQDINDASQSISKIIKTIDDIAFQTNILALNAAVEAARAGHHGKGFAVVAEEVRSLAAKSAEAAKETGYMIQNSMEKAEFGSSIASETAISLAEIVTGINESSRLIEEIAKASEEQSEGINQVNIGIDQVAHVVNQNSATAEESAAASQEMSNQSELLNELITQFRLRKEKPQDMGLRANEESEMNWMDEQGARYNVNIAAKRIGKTNKYAM